MDQSTTPTPPQGEIEAFDALKRMIVEYGQACAVLGVAEVRGDADAKERARHESCVALDAVSQAIDAIASMRDPEEDARDAARYRRVRYSVWPDDEDDDKFTLSLRTPHRNESIAGFFDDAADAAVIAARNRRASMQAQAPLSAEVKALQREVEELRADKARLVEDRARFPDRPDDIGRMLTAHYGSLKATAKANEDAWRRVQRIADEHARDAARYRWLCDNNFDRQGPPQIHTWLHTWEPHSRTGEPTEWKQRIRGGARLAEIIDAAMASKAEPGEGNQ